MSDLPKPDYARNMRVVGHSDQGGRPDGVQVMVYRGFAYVGHMFSEGFSVIDRLTGEPATCANTRYSGISEEDADAICDVLNRRARGRSLLISPFDSLAWDRARTERLFGFRHRLEAYVPRHKRVHGYFAMPVLGGTTFVGLVDPGRRGRTLVAKQVTLFRSERAGHVAAALAAAARWVGCDRIIVERVAPPAARRGLASLVAEAASDLD